MFRQYRILPTPNDCSSETEIFDIEPRPSFLANFARITLFSDLCLEQNAS